MILPKLNAIILLVILQISITLQHSSSSFSAVDSFQVPFWLLSYLGRPNTCFVDLKSTIFQFFFKVLDNLSNTDAPWHPTTRLNILSLSFCSSPLSSPLCLFTFSSTIFLSTHHVISLAGFVNLNTSHFITQDNWRISTNHLWTRVFVFLN